MNPFLFSYSLKVDQSEIQDTGFLNFLKLLGSPVSDLIGSVGASSRSNALSATSGGTLTSSLSELTNPQPHPILHAKRLSVMTPKPLLKELAEVRDKVIKERKSTEKAVSDAAEI